MAGCPATAAVAAGQPATGRPAAAAAAEATAEAGQQQGSHWTGTGTCCGEPCLPNDSEQYLEGKDDDLVALGVALQAGVAVGLKARVGGERDLLLPWILPIARKHRRHILHTS